jgi:hypothetical protein
MERLTRADLLSLEQYAESRPAFRARVLAHKQDRQVRIGPHVTLLFEDRLTVQYQIQEMLRIERIFEAAAIEEELGAYNPLIPDGSNLKATFLLEFPDPEERHLALRRLVGIEGRVWASVGGGERVLAVADEDLPRSTEEKTSAVHFLRFEFPPTAREALLGGASLGFGIDHPAYREGCPALPEVTRQALVRDLA